MSSSTVATLVGVSAAEQKAVTDLQDELNNGLPSDFEKLCARLVSRLLDVPVVVSSSGYQFGADAGTVGLRGRSLRIECKRYLESTSANARSLKGQVEEAVQADPSLEAWILISTKTISEMDQKSISLAGESRGVPAVVIDWTVGTGALPRLACLCSAFADEVEALYGAKAATAARILTASGAKGVAAQRDDLQPWAIGFKDVRARSLSKLSDIWNKRNESLARLNQNAAGGSSGVLIHRAGPTTALRDWWKTPQPTGPAAIHGPEGHGKTWAVLDWLVCDSDELPIVLTVPASALVGGFTYDENALMDLIGSRLRSVCEGPLESAYWRRRAERLLLRPASEPAAILLFIDGLNQNPSAPWGLLARVSQAERFGTGLRLAFTVRTSFLKQMREFEPLAYRVASIAVGPYSDGVGGELELALKAHGIAPNVLHPSLRGQAAVPRVLPLIARLKHNVALQSDTTVHRVLWEYALDEHRQRTDASFTSTEFEEWISQQATMWRASVIEQRSMAPMTRTELAGSVSSPETTPDEVARKLSDLIDGRWVATDGAGGKKFSAPPQTLLLGLAVAILDLLRDSANTSIDGKFDELERWLEPIAGFDEATEVVRAALAILTAKNLELGDVTTASALMRAWLYAQNPTQSFEQDVLALGTQLPVSLLDAMERAKANAHAHALDISAQALRRVPVANTADWLEIESRLELWCARLVCPRPEDVAKGSDHYAAGQAARMTERIGTSVPGYRTVLGVTVSIDYSFDSNLFRVAPSVLEGHATSKLRRPFIAAAIAFAVRSSYDHLAWDGFKALALYPPVADAELREALRAWSAEVAARTPEPGVTPFLPARIAALLLWASAEARDEAKAKSINPRLEQHRSYAAQYEADPARSGFSLEFRHISEQLSATDLPLISRLKRLSRLLGDPAIPRDASVVEELDTMAVAFPVDDMDSHNQRTINEFHFEETVAGMARFNPAALAVLVQRRLSAMATRGASAKYWAALRAREFLLLATPEISEALETYRTTTVATSSHDDQIANSWLLQVTAVHSPVEEQLQRVASKGAFLSVDLLKILRPGGYAVVADILAKPNATLHEVTLALDYVATSMKSCAGELQDQIVKCLASSEEQIRISSVLALYAVAPDRLSRELLAASWTAGSGETLDAHYGSLAIAEHGRHLPFEDIATTIAPWCLFSAAQLRGGSKPEFELAVRVVEHILSNAPCDLETFGHAQLVYDRSGDARISFTEPDDILPAPLSRPDETHAEVNSRMTSVHDRITERIAEIRGQGSRLLLHEFDVPSLSAAWDVCSSAMRHWLEGVEERSQAFTSRVRGADGFFFALCEVLLQKEPSLGAALWRALAKIVPNRFQGPAGVSGLIHLLFKAPSSPEVNQLRSDAISPEACPSDTALLDVVIAARMQKSCAWLMAVVEADRSADQQWRRRRCIVLDGLLSEPDPNALTWPAGEPLDTWVALRNDMQVWSNCGALARYWWQQYLAASIAEEAYAAFIVFLACADRRAHAWMWDDLGGLPLNSELNRLRYLHCILNKDAIRREMKKREDELPKLGNRLFGAGLPREWLVMDGLKFV